jgi:hypothetical protein
MLKMNPSKITGFLVSLSLLLAFSVASNAQRTFRFGMKAAPLVSWMKPDFQNIPADFSFENAGIRMGFAWGPVAEIQLNETFLISTGLDINYTSGKLQGNLKNPVDASIVKWEQLYKNRFIELPVMLKFRTKEIGYLRYFGLFGMGAGFRYKAETEFSRESSTVTVTTPNKDDGKYINSFRGSLQVGGGVEYSLTGNTALVGSIVFNNGLTNMLKNQFEAVIPGINQDPFNTVEEKAITNYLQLNIGILF